MIGNHLSNYTNIWTRKRSRSLYRLLRCRLWLLDVACPMLHLLDGEDLFLHWHPGSLSTLNTMPLPQKQMLPDSKCVVGRQQSWHSFLVWTTGSLSTTSFKVLKMASRMSIRVALYWQRKLKFVIHIRSKSWFLWTLNEILFLPWQDLLARLRKLKIKRPRSESFLCMD